MRFLRLIVLCLFVFRCEAEETFLLVDGVTGEVVSELGPCVNERISPCSSFKIVLSLMGYDAEILKDEGNPVWDFQDGYDDFLESWKAPLTPRDWMNYSCVWYSKVLAVQLGLERMQAYLSSIEYGNKDLSGGLAPPGPTTVAWINSSLKISPREQVEFIKKMVLEKFSISSKALQMTKAILFKEALPGGWKLFGKTGWSGSDVGLEHGWFVGWIEKDERFFPFAYLIREPKIKLDQRIPRVKKLLMCIYD